MPLRVLYLDHTAKIGGGEIALVNLLRHLDRSVVFPIALLFMEGPLRERLVGCCDTHVIPLADSALTAKKDGLGWRSLFQSARKLVSAIADLEGRSVCSEDGNRPDPYQLLESGHYWWHSREDRGNPGCVARERPDRSGLPAKDGGADVPLSQPEPAGFCDC